ncbi:hypothetical protein WJX72_005633 [[Myrmecia] bisecta]|uniref:EF-hand domain-containing protein n=1 Tax=[Myrmecia] bisecta TaxID=41462 RepID=A0AAW1PT57_9CHLO
MEKTSRLLGVGALGVGSATVSKDQAIKIFGKVDRKGYGFLPRKELAIYLQESLANEAPGYADNLITGLNLKADGTISQSEFAKLYVRYFRQNSEAASVAKHASTAASRAAAVSARCRSTKQQYICIRGSSGLNSLSGSKAFRLTIVRQKSAKRLQECFNAIDTDLNGRVSCSEFKMFLRKTSPNLEKMAQGIFTTMDKAGTGQLTFKDLLHALYPGATKEELRTLLHMARGKNAQARFVFSPQKISELKAMFLAYDDDTSGEINQAEFVVGLQNSGYTEEEAEDMFAVVDTDHSGTIKFEEFLAWYRKELESVAMAAHHDTLDDSSDDSGSDSDDDEFDVRNDPLSPQASGLALGDLTPRLLANELL